MNYWLHFIGKQYYTRASFTREAKAYSASRRVSLADLKRMDWQDTVLLAILEGKTPVLFGRFIIKTLSGLSADARLVLEKFYGLKKVSEGGDCIFRGCGEYITGPTYQIDASLPEIALVLESLKQNGVDIGKPLLSGPFEELPTPVRLVDIKHRQGFRLFNFQEFTKAMKSVKQPKRGLLRIHGHFYVDGSPERRKGGAVQEVRGYIQKKERQTA